MPIKRDILHRKTILVVDDDHKSLDIVKIVLEHYGGTVITVTNGEEGFNKASRSQPDIILSDLSMPGTDGWALLKKIRAEDQLRAVPVIAFTAHAMHGDQEKGLNAGFDGYMIKPFTATDFIERFLEVINTLPEHDLTPNSDDS